MADVDIVTRVYGNFRGVDFRGDEINLSRSPDSLNVWKDYKETDSIRTRPGLELYCELPGTVYGVWFFNGVMIAHVDKYIYKIVSNDNKTILYSDAVPGASNAFVYKDRFYFKDSRNYIYYDGETVRDVVGYIPTTSIARKPLGGGTVYEDVNMLSDYRKNTFLADGESKEFFLDAQNIDTDYVPVAMVNGEYITAINTNYAQGKIYFEVAPSAPLTDGQDNVVIQFKKKVTGYRDNILKCTLVQPFDNRVFFSGNKDYPNVVWHCSLDDPTYFSDLDYYREGLDSADIRGLVAGNNALWVFREPSDANTTVFYHTPTTDDEYGKIYPSTHSSVTIGCVGRAINFNDDIVFFSERGMEGISGDITTEQVAAHRSSFVDRKMIAEADYKNMILEEWEGYLMVFIGSKVYLADSRTAFTNENHIEYEWFMWDLGVTVISTAVHGGVLYIGTSDGVYTLTDNEANVESYWVTPKDKFKTANRLKTTNKRGCVAEATGDVSVYAKLEDTDFELIGKYENVTDYFVSRIKRKKFKDIQLKFYSDTRFSLETVSLECFLGGYIKR
jgi:hypothetical protein